ncbi:hypothetical protein [Streptomyces lavendulae]|uniref:hypothetical protein n=1 Tax=Streptomyces lavendulae TaxID=1914 RepID=UPI0033F84E12
MRQHLVDAPHDWKGLGMDLLQGAPDHVLDHFGPDGSRFASAYLDNVVNIDGTPAEPIPITEDNSEGLEWGYVLHDQGTEVIALTWYNRGPTVSWGTDPLARVSGTPSLWAPDRPAPVQSRPTPLKITKPAAPPPATARPQVTR